MTDREDAPATAPASTEKETPAPSPKRRWPRALGRVALGLGLGLAVAEVAFYARDKGAFPHVNMYAPDARLGVRLMPFATQRIVFGKKNPVTSLRVNRDGLRGADLPPQGDAEILVVGDSQVFGLGVEEHETASAVLQTMLGRTVINAGVPTYGPPEYNLVVADMLEKRRIQTVVYVINMVNDPFEAAHPNTERHAVWDGWAVRKETAPPHVTQFPGRDLLYRRSHLFYALRSYLYARGPGLDEKGFASEGAPADLVSAAAKASDERARADRETQAKKDARAAAIQDVEKKERAADLAVEELALDTFLLRGHQEGWIYQRARTDPGDIVLKTVDVSEEGRRPPRTASVLYNGAQVRRRVEARIRALAALVLALDQAGVTSVNKLPPEEAAHWQDHAWISAQFGDQGDPERSVIYLAEQVARGLLPNGSQAPFKGREHPLVKTVAEREALLKKLEALRTTPAETVRARSPMAPLLREVKALCDAKGAKLLVVALPMDLQVHPAEWAKYGNVQPIDMKPTLILIDDLVASAEAIGAYALDATPALAAAEPGAFLGADIHMTPKGQRAFARAIAEKIRATKGINPSGDSG